MRGARKGWNTARPSTSKVKLGENSNKIIMESKACEIGKSPKRSIPMETDTPPKRRRRQSVALQSN